MSESINLPSGSGWKNNLKFWKYPSILLTAAGIAYTGDWVFLLALNLTMLEMSGSALAIAGLYMLKPFAMLCTSSWSGSVIDRLNKRSMMVGLDLLRALLIVMLPFISNLWIIYILVFVIDMASSMFRPTSMAYIVRLVPQDRRKRFNAIHGLISSGAFLIGPAAAGLLFLIMSPHAAIVVTAISFFGSALLTLLLPNLERRQTAQQTGEVKVEQAGSKDAKDSKNATVNRSPWTILREDWRLVLQFSRKVPIVMTIYLLFYLIMVLTAGLDSQEVALTKQVLHVTDSEYSYLVSIAGAGIGVGALINMFIVKRLSIAVLLGAGSVGVGIGYMIYAFAHSFGMVAVGFFVLAFFLAFANTGFTTFYQNHVPDNMMGRISGVYSVVIAVLQMLIVFAVGMAAELWSISGAVRVGAAALLLIAIVLSMVSMKQIKDTPEPSVETQNQVPKLAVSDNTES